MENLTKENFFNELMEKFPEAMAEFCAWIDQYKIDNDWETLFNPQGTLRDDQKTKFHHLPLAMQIGISVQYLADVKNELKEFDSFPGFFRDQLEERQEFLTEEN